MHEGSTASAIVVLGGDDDDASVLEAMGDRCQRPCRGIGEAVELVETIRRVARGKDSLKSELLVANGSQHLR